MGFFTRAVTRLTEAGLATRCWGCRQKLVRRKAACFWWWTRAARRSRRLLTWHMRCSITPCNPLAFSERSKSYDARAYTHKRKMRSGGCRASESRLEIAQQLDRRGIAARQPFLFGGIARPPVGPNVLPLSHQPTGRTRLP